MPVKTQLIRNGKPVSVGGWTWWHLVRLHEAMKEENPFEDEKKTPFFPDYKYIFREAHIFESPEREIWTDGEHGKTFVFSIEPGDEYRAWR